MKRYLGKRILILAVTMLGVGFLIFILQEAQPGNPYYNMMKPGMRQEQIEQYLVKKGYYDPVPLKYIKWLQSALKGDFGYSIRHKAPVLELIRNRLPNTLKLTLPAFGIALLSSMLLGTFWAEMGTSSRSKALDGFFLIISSLPTFLIALIAVKFLSFDWEILPLTGIGEEGIDRLRHLILPTGVLALIQTAGFSRYIRDFISSELRKPYIKSAMAMGYTKREVLFRQTWRNISVTFITMIFMEIPSLLSGALITETFFVIPGIGKLNYDAVVQKDYPLVMGILTLSIFLVLISNFLADICGYFLDKRQKL